MLVNIYVHASSPSFCLLSKGPAVCLPLPRRWFPLGVWLVTLPVEPNLKHLIACKSTAVKP
jgi:hypothetical protein